MASEQEIWKDIPGYEGLYQVSSFGRVKSLSREAAVQSKSHRSVPSKILSLNMNRGGYPSVCLCRENKKTTYLLHRLVAQAFIANPKGKRTVNHINGNKSDNRVSNLEWNTYSENIAHAFKVLGRQPTRPWLGKGGKGYHANKKIHQLSIDGKFIREFDSITEAAESINLSLSAMSRVLTGKHKTAGGFMWAYSTDYNKL